MIIIDKREGPWPGDILANLAKRAVVMGEKCLPNKPGAFIESLPQEIRDILSKLTSGMIGYALVGREVAFLEVIQSLLGTRRR